MGQNPAEKAKLKWCIHATEADRNCVLKNATLALWRWPPARTWLRFAGVLRATMRDKAELTHCKSGKGHLVLCGLLCFVGFQMILRFVGWRSRWDHLTCRLLFVFVLIVLCLVEFKRIGPTSSDPSIHQNRAWQRKHDNFLLPAVRVISTTIWTKKRFWKTIICNMRQLPEMTLDAAIPRRCLTSAAPLRVNNAEAICAGRASNSLPLSRKVMPSFSLKRKANLPLVAVGGGPPPDATGGETHPHNTCTHAYTHTNLNTWSPSYSLVYTVLTVLLSVLAQVLSSCYISGQSPTGQDRVKQIGARNTLPFGSESLAR